MLFPLLLQILFLCLPILHFPPVPSEIIFEVVILLLLLGEFMQQQIKAVENFDSLYLIY